MLRTIVIVFALIAVARASENDGDVREPWNFPAARQFDFWIGEWDVNLRMIQDDLTWEDRVKAKAKIYRILDGKAILELWNSQSIKGFSLRHFDPRAKEWILWLNWPQNNRSGTGSLKGSFRHGRGEFFVTRKNQEGQEILSRYTFSDITATTLRWDDAFSSDGGKTWSSNWIMEFSRTMDQPSWPDAGEKAHTFETGQRCDSPQFRKFEILEGEWQGQIRISGTDEGWLTGPATFSGYKILDGCAVMSLLEYDVGGDPVKSFSVKTFNTYINKYEDIRLDNAWESVVERYYGDAEDGKIALLEPTGDDSTLVAKKYIWNFQDPEQFGFQLFESVDSGRSWKETASCEFDRVTR